MSKIKIYKSDPNMLKVLYELDYLIALLNDILNSLEPESKSLVGLNHVLERTERLRTLVACMSSDNIDWVGILQAVVCITHYVTRLWK